MGFALPFIYAVNSASDKMANKSQSGIRGVFLAFSSPLKHLVESLACKFSVRLIVLCPFGRISALGAGANLMSHYFLTSGQRLEARFGVELDYMSLFLGLIIK